MSVPDSAPSDLPEPSAELVLLRVFVEAHLVTSPRKRGERYLRRVADALVKEANMAAVLQIRPREQIGAYRRALKEATTLFERYLPSLVASLPEE